MRRRGAGKDQAPLDALAPFVQLTERSTRIHVTGGTEVRRYGGTESERCRSLTVLTAKVVLGITAAALLLLHLGDAFAI